MSSLNADTRLLHLPDRTIAYSISTPPSPRRTLIYLHGYPSSRLEALALTPLAQARGLQLISPDRPGFGQSTFRPYAISDVQDVLAVADAAGVDHFSVLGASGGGPFALALADHPRVERVGLLATAAPWDGPVNDSSAVRRVAAVLAQTPLFAPMAKAAVAAGRWAVGLPRVQRKIDAWLLQQMDARQAGPDKKAADLDAVWNPEATPEGTGMALAEAVKKREEIVRTLLEPFATGVEGFTHETRLLTQPWGIDFEEIQKEVRVWHARGDRASPLSMVLPMVERLPRGKITVYEGGHGDVAGVLGEVMDYSAEPPAT